MQPPVESTPAKILRPLRSHKGEGPVVISDLNLCGSSPQSIGDLFQTMLLLAEEKEINAIHFKGGKINEQIALGIEEFLAQSTSVHTVIFEQILNDKTIFPILRGLAASKHIFGLELAFNNITNQSLKALAGILEKGSTLANIKLVCSGSSYEMFEPILKKNDILVIDFVWRKDLLCELNQWNQKSRKYIINLQSNSELFDNCYKAFLAKKSSLEDLLNNSKTVISNAQDLLKDLLEEYNNPPTYEDPRTHAALREKIIRNIKFVLEIVLIIQTKLMAVDQDPAMTLHKGHLVIADLSALIKKGQIPEISNAIDDFLVKEGQVEHENMRGSKANYSIYRRRFLIIQSMIPRESPHFGATQHVLATNAYNNLQTPCISLLNAYPYLIRGCQAQEEMCQLLLSNSLANLINGKSELAITNNLMLTNMIFTADVGVRLLSEVQTLLYPFTPGYFSYSFYQRMITVDQYLQTQENTFGIIAKSVVTWLSEKSTLPEFSHLLPILFKLDFVIKKMITDFGAEDPNLFEILNAISNAFSIYCAHANVDQRPVHLQVILAQIYNHASTKKFMPALEDELANKISHDITKFDPYEKESAAKLIGKANEVLKLISDKFNAIPFYQAQKKKLDEILKDKHAPLPGIGLFRELINQKTGVIPSQAEGSLRYPSH